MIHVKIAALNPDAQAPQRMTEGASGFDLYCTDPQRILPGERVLVGTGLALEIPLGFEGQIRSRSGLALKYGIQVINSPGTIDSDYRGEVKVLLHNFGDKIYTCAKGERIAQLVFAKVEQSEFVFEPLAETTRNEGGFGSTGT